MISLPHTIEPPDLIIVEVLDALPGRPISGERLIRPDGKISLGFYGEVFVRGLTLIQVKVAVIKLLRKHGTDEALGLLAPGYADPPPGDAEPTPAKIQRPVVPLPQEAPSVFPPEDDTPSKKKARPSTRQSQPSSRSRAVRPAASSPGRRLDPTRPLRARVSQTTHPAQDSPAPLPNSLAIPVGGDATITITIESKSHAKAQMKQAEQTPEPRDVDELPMTTIVAPAESLTVFVDVTAYNSQNFYVLGDVVVTGRMPWTGNETVLDALQYAGGLTSAGEPKDIRLVRPGRGGKPERIYKIDLAAIQERGDATKNYQIFPNDRLIVGRNEVVKKTTEIDRLNAPIQSVVSALNQQAILLRSLQSVTGDHREELLKELVNFWAKTLSRPGDLQFNEQTLRDALIPKTKLTPPPAQTPPAPR